MTVPTIRVEVAFGLGAYSTPGGGDWVDITSDVFSITTQRGRQSEFDQFPAGTATIGLYNDTRVYDPLNTAGPYYGDLLANTPIRVVATISAVDYHIWRGYVDGWPAEYTHAGHRSEVLVRCTDAFRLLAERLAPDTHLLYLGSLGTPTNMWYKCDVLHNGRIENNGLESVIGRDLVSTVPLSITEPLLPVSNGALAIPAQWSPDSTSSAWAAAAPIYSAGDNITSGTRWTLAMSFRIVDRGFRGLFEIPDPETPGNFCLLLLVGTTLAGTTNPMTYAIYTPTNSLSGSSNVDVGDGAVHTVVLVRDITTANLYIDGALVSTDTDGAATGAFDAIGGHVILGRTPFGLGAQGPAVVIDEIMGWDAVFLAGSVQSLHEQWLTGATTYATGGAVSQMLDAIEWPASLRQVSTGEYFAQITRDFSGSVLAFLQNMATCEGGRVFVDAQGRVVFHDRSRFMTQSVESAVQYTFSSQNRDTAPVGVGLRDGTLSITVDDRLSYDAAVITRQGGVAQSAQLTTTPARTYSASGLLFPSDAHAKNLAEWIVFRYGTPKARSEAWEIDPETMPADWDNILTLDIGHRIKHDITPGGIGSSINLEQHVSYIAHQITPREWIITMNGTPVDPNEAAYFLWASTATADNDNGWADTDGDPPGGYWG